MFTEYETVYSTLQMNRLLMCNKAMSTTAASPRPVQLANLCIKMIFELTSGKYDLHLRGCSCPIFY